MGLTVKGQLMLKDARCIDSRPCHLIIKAAFDHKLTEVFDQRLGLQGQPLPQVRL